MILKMTKNTGSEFYCLIIDTTEGAEDEVGQKIHAMGWRETKNHAFADIGDDPEVLDEIAHALESWGDPDGGFDPDASFRFRPFQRMAKEIRTRLEELGMSKLITLSPNQHEPFLRNLRDLLTATYGDAGGSAKIVDGRIIFEQSMKPTETRSGDYTKVTIAIEEVKTRI